VLTAGNEGLREGAKSFLFKDSFQKQKHFVYHLCESHINLKPNP